MRRLCLLVLLVPSLAMSQEPRDKRYEKPLDYNGTFPWTAPKDVKEWESRRERVKQQVLFSQGLWPMPPKGPLEPMIHGSIERDGYVIKKAAFQSLPGHYVTGNLYMPTGRTGKLPAVLCPHGHWANGRFYEANDKEIDRQIKLGAESTREGAKYPLQARCVQLARMGCVVFHYDMTGYADSLAIKHREGFKDADAELWLTSFMGLQTWNSIRAFDFLASLPEVDPARIAVTGSSGGGTQTFLLGAVDERPVVLVPAVMVSTSMQGGCVCENSSGLRVETGNIELAGLTAPRPQFLIGADDWTREIETKGMPQLKDLYRLLGAEDRFGGKALLKFPHNYNQPSRELMYAFLNKHLKLGHTEPIVERPFVPVAPAELKVFDDSHPMPKDAADAGQVRAWFKKTIGTTVSEAAAQSSDEPLRKIVAPGLRAMIVDELPGPKDVVDAIPNKKVDDPTWIVRDYWLTRKGKGEVVRARGACGKNFGGSVLVWVHPDGIESLYKDGQFHPAVVKWMEADGGILAVEPFRTGESASQPRPPVDKNYAGFTYGYNRSLLANRVHDILTAIALAKHHSSTRSVSLVGFDEAGPWSILAAGLCDGVLQKTAVDLNRFRFDSVESTDDEMMLPGALRMGGLPSIARLSVQFPLLMHNAEGTGCENHAKYAPAGQVRVDRQKLDAMAAIDWLLAK